MALFTLQGLGNSILAFPILANLKKQYDVTIYLADRHSAMFYSDLKLCNVVILPSLFQILMHQAARTDIAASLYPNWKRELWELNRAHASKKFSFIEPKYPFTRLFKTQKIKAEKIHDIENNFKLLDELKAAQSYPNLTRFFPKTLQKKVSVHLTASNPLKYYSKKFWLGIIDHFIKEHFKIELFMGNSNEEKQFLKNLLKKLKPNPLIQIHIGERLSRVAETLAESKVFIGLDSALMHLAALLDVYTIGLWSYADFHRIYPYGNFCHVYIPREILSASDYKPKRGLTCRAKCDDILEIAYSGKTKSFAIQPKFVAPVSFYEY